MFNKKPKATESMVYQCRDALTSLSVCTNKREAIHYIDTILQCGPLLTQYTRDSPLVCGGVRIWTENNSVRVNML